MKLTKKFLSALLVCAAAVTMLCAAASATAAPVTAETPAQKQAVLDTINAVRQQNGLAPVAETADADAQADRMAALYFSTDDGDAYDAQWLAILDTEVEGKVSIGDCYSYKLQNGGWDITDWNNMDLLPTPAFKLLKSAAANAENNHQMDPEKLYVSTCYANPGPIIKRIMPRAQGRAYRINKRTSHVTIAVSER